MKTLAFLRMVKTSQNGFLSFQVYSITNKEAETPHETAFHRRYREAIDATMLKIRKPADPSR